MRSERNRGGRGGSIVGIAGIGDASGEGWGGVLPPSRRTRRGGFAIGRGCDRSRERRRAHARSRSRSRGRPPAPRGDARGKFENSGGPRVPRRTTGDREALLALALARPGLARPRDPVRLRVRARSRGARGSGRSVTYRADVHEPPEPVLSLGEVGIPQRRLERVLLLRHLEARLLVLPVPASLPAALALPAPAPGLAVHVPLGPPARVPAERGLAAHRARWRVTRTRPRARLLGAASEPRGVYRTLDRAIARGRESRARAFPNPR